MHLDDADVEDLAFVRLRRLAQGCSGVLFLFSLRRTLGCLTFILTSDNPLELVWVDAGLISVASLLERLEWNMGCLAVVVSGTAEHLRLNLGLHQTLRDLLDKLGHFDGRFLIRALLVEELKHLSHQRLAHDQLDADFLVFLL